MSILQQHTTARLNNERGEGILGFLVGSLLGLLLLSSALESYFQASYRSFDLQLISQTRERAKNVLDLMVFDLRMMGAGMPLGQANFQISGVGLSTAPLPLLTTSNATSISFRRNEKGANTALTLDYLPDATHLMLTVSSASAFSANDPIYISDVTTGGTGGMRAIVSSHTGTHISLQAATWIASAGTTFKAGSIVEPVKTISYDMLAGTNGISRDSGSGAVTIAPDVSFSLRYFDTTGVELVPPLTEAVIRDNLASIEVTITAQSSAKKKDGTFYTATMSQRVGLRNLYLSR